MKHSLLTLLVFVTSFAFAQDELFEDAAFQRFYYLGTKGDYQVQMELTLKKSAATGTLFFDLIGAPIELRGKLNGAATDTGLPYILEELDENGKAVAVFEGELSNSPYEFGSTFAGTWSCNGCANPAPLPFRLERVAEFANVTFEQNRIEVSSTYPVFLGDLATFNKGINQSEIVNRILADFEQGQEVQQAGDLLYFAWTTHSHYTIRYASQRLVSLLETVDSYTGGAHGNYGFAGHTFLQQNGEVESLEFQDLFAENADLSPIAQFVKDDLTKQEASFIPEDFSVKTLTDLSTFTLSPKGITFHFGPYAVGSYAEGAYEVTVMLEEIIDILRPEIASEFVE